MSKARAKVIIKGIVQGVNFRSYTHTEAQKRSLTGWVCNLEDGSVAALFEGEQEDVDAMIQWCLHGPPSARVTQVIAQPEEPKGEFSSFTVRY